MKKCAILTLCLVMLASVALAGTTPIEVEPLTNKYALIYTQPEGVASIEIMDIGDMKVLTYTMEAAGSPTYVLTVSHSEVLDGLDLTDLSDEAIGQLVMLTAYEAENFTYEHIIMDDGWPAVLIIYEDDSDMVDAFTLTEGYLIQMHGYHADFSELTEAEDRMALTLLDDVNVVPSDDWQDDAMAGMPNPMLDATEDAFVSVAGSAPTLPEGAENVAYFQYTTDDAMAEVQFEADGIAYTFRASAGEEADTSGMYVTFADEAPIKVGDLDGTAKVNEGAEGVALWYDAQASINYSLSTSQGATAAGLEAMANQLTAAQ